MTDKKINGLIEHNQNLNKIILESLEESLTNLMKHKNYQQISITELCMHAGVSRMAFYNNYQSKDNLLKSIIIKSTQTIITNIGSPFRQIITEEWFVKLFKEVNHFSETLKLIFDAGLEYTYLSVINEIVLQDKTLSSLVRISRLTWVGGIINTIIYWIKSQKKETISEIASFCYNSFSKQTQI